MFQRLPAKLIADHGPPELQTMHRPPLRSP